MLEVCNVTKHFEKEDRKITALDSVSFSVKEGEIVGLLGPNGSGKTTLINLIVGFYLPDDGDVKVYGESIYKNPKLVQEYVRIPFLLEDPRFSVYETLKLTAKFFGVKDYKEKIDYWLKYFELEKDRNTQIQKLSMGNYRKVQIIGSLISDPKLLILDEITNGLDLITVNKLIETLKKVNEERSVSILFASHIFSHVEKLCPRVIILYNGRILADDSIENLKKKARLKEYITVETKEPLPQNLFNKISESFEIIHVEENIYKIVCEDASQELRSFSRFLVENPEVDQLIKDISIKETDLEDVFAYFVAKHEE
jgi:ABC-2 type transport system ATP-binding protein